MTNCIGHILRRNCLPKDAIEGKIEVTERRGRRRKHLLEELEEIKRILWIERGNTLWRTGFGRGYGPVVRHTAEGMTYSVNWSVSARNIYARARAKHDRTVITQRLAFIVTLPGKQQCRRSCRFVTANSGTRWLRKCVVIVLQREENSWRTMVILIT